MTPEELAYFRTLRALETKASSLDLSYLGLKSVPPLVSKCGHLKELNLAGNRLTQFPVEVLSIRFLKTLNLSFNHIQEVPEEINNLLCVETLNLQGNQISQLPKGIFLRNLVELNLAFNKLSKLPRQLEVSHWLEKLDLSFNQFTQIPEPVVYLRRLGFINLKGNKIEQISKVLFHLLKLNNLSRTNFADNPLKEPFLI